MSTLSGRTIAITGGSRGIGRAIALRAARDGAKVAILAKTAEPHPKLPGTIYSVAEEIEEAGGTAMPLQVDIRDESAVEEAITKVAEGFGALDVLVNNASAIQLMPTADLPVRRFDLMNQVNYRGSFVCSQAAVPFLRQAENPHILTLSPPPEVHPRWFAGFTPYTISKFSMSMLMLGMAEELRKDGVACNTLWPRTVIDTAALNMLGDMVDTKYCRKPEIMADAFHAIVTRPAREFTGQHVIDETILRQDGVTDFDAYAVAPGNKLLRDLYINDSGDDLVSWPAQR